jgi:hypothetical protein
MSSRGFTKIEILIVVIIAIIIIISDVFIIIFLNAKERDIQILSEISQIRSGFEVFLLANNYYPIAMTPIALNDTYASTEKLCLDGMKQFADQCQKNILNPMPNYYLQEGNQYRYQSLDNNQNYQLEFILGTNFEKQGLKKGVNCANNSQILSQPCF